MAGAGEKDKKPEPKRAGPSPTAAVREDKGESMLDAAEDALIALDPSYRPRRAKPEKRPPWWKSPVAIGGAVVLVLLLGAAVYYRETHRVHVAVAPPRSPGGDEAARKTHEIEELLAAARRAYVADKISGGGDDSFLVVLAKIETLEPHQLDALSLRSLAVAELKTRGDAKASRNEVDSAIIDFRNALALQPKDLEAPPRLTQLVVRRAGEKPALERAALVSLLDEVAPLVPDDRDLHLAIADLFAANREWTRAVAQYEHVLQLQPYDEAAQKGLDKAKRRLPKK